MHLNVVAISLVKLFAVGLVIFAFRNAGMTVFFIAHGDTSAVEVYMLITGIIVPVLIAALMWVSPERIIGQPPESNSSPSARPLDAGSSFSVGIALMGIYLAASAIPSILVWLVRHSQQRQAFGEMLHVAAPSYFSLFSDVFMLVVGVLFFVGSSRITRLFLDLRNFGVDVQEPHERESGGKSEKPE